jgi:hypothetical protein
MTNLDKSNLWLIMPFILMCICIIVVGLIYSPCAMAIVLGFLAFLGLCVGMANYYDELDRNEEDD